MKVYNMSSTLKPGDTLTNDYRGTANLAQPFVAAMEMGRNCFLSMVLNSQYVWAVLDHFELNATNPDYDKWSVEGLFEYIRKTEFPDCYSRLKSSFFYDDETSQSDLFDYVWGNAPEQGQRAVKFYEIELEDDSPDKRDMLWFDKAYDIMSETQDVGAVMNIARKYFSGEATANPIWELLSDKRAVVVQERIQ